MSVTEKLDDLYQEWEDSYSPYKGCFIRDGIIDPDSFEKQQIKVLFIGKEPNDPSQSEWDFRRWWKEEGLKYGFSFRLAEWAYGILHDFPTYRKACDDKAGLQQALCSTAFMNVKKSGGGGEADNAEIDRVAGEKASWLRRQIELISPNIVIGCLMGCDGSWTAMFPDAKWKHDGNFMWIGRVGNMRLIEFYHPSNRYPGVMKYLLLKEIIKSEDFRNL